MYSFLIILGDKSINLSKWENWKKKKKSPLGKVSEEQVSWQRSEY